MATSDVHMHIFDHDYLADSGLTGSGLEALVPVIKSLRETASREHPARNCLLFDNGDLLQGTPLADQIARNDLTNGHPVAQVMTELGYTAFGLGNHDLDFDLSVLASFAESFSGDVVSSNLELSDRPDWLKRHTIVQVGDIKVGVLSVLPQPTKAWAVANALRISDIQDLADTVRDTSAHLRNSGADIVVALAHSGIGPEAGENELEEIAASGNVDILVGGHTHLRFPSADHQEVSGADPSAGTLHGVPLIMPGFAGAFLGSIDIDVTRSEAGEISVSHITSQLHPARSGMQSAPEEFAHITESHDQTRRQLDLQVGVTDRPLSTYFAQISATPLMGLVAAAQYGAMDAARVGSRFADLPMLSAVSPFRGGGRGGPSNFTAIDTGPVKERHVADLSIFENYVWAVEVTGSDLVEWLERSASGFNTISHQTSNSDLLSIDTPSFDFDQIYGLTYSINPTKPPRYSGRSERPPADTHRISDIRHNGVLITATDRFLVATTSYRACGGGRFPGMSPSRPVLRPDIRTDDVLRGFFTSRDAGYETTPWQFASECAGIETWFETSPQAVHFLDQIVHLTPGLPEQQENGFVRIPITL